MHGDVPAKKLTSNDLYGPSESLSIIAMQTLQLPAEILDWNQMLQTRKYEDSDKLSLEDFVGMD